MKKLFNYKFHIRLLKKSNSTTQVQQQSFESRRYFQNGGIFVNIINILKAIFMKIVFV